MSFKKKLFINCPAITALILFVTSSFHEISILLNSGIGLLGIFLQIQLLFIQLIIWGVLLINKISLC